MSGRHRVARRLVGAALVTIVALLGLAAPAVATPSGDPGRGSTASGLDAPDLHVIAQNFEVAPDGTFSVYLRVTDAPADADIAVDIYDAISDADDLAASTTDTPANERARFDPYPLADRATASQQTGFTISLFTRGQPRPAGAGPWAYRLDEPGVYPVRVRLRDTDGNVLSVIVTYLVRIPADTTTVKPARVALLTTVHQPARAHRGREAAPVSAAYLQALTQTLGRFRSHGTVPATFAVTPDTTTRLQADRSGGTALASLAEEASRPSRDLLGAPFVDLDPARLVHEGLADEVVRQADLGARTLTDTMGQPGSNTWVVDHHVDTGTLETLRDLGVAHLILPGSAVVGSSAQPVLLPSSTGINAVTSSVFDLRGTTPDDPILAAHQLLGRLAAVGSITPNGAGLVVRLDGAGVDGRELSTVLTALDEPSVYLEPTTVSRLFQEVPTTTAPVATLAPPSTAGLGRYPEELRRTNAMIASYGSMLADPTVAVQTFEEPVAVSAADSLRESQRLEMLSDVQDQIQRRLQGISLPVKDRVTLGARDARFPLPISSTTGEPLKVVITLEASDRLSFPRHRIETVLGRERTTVQIPVRTRATGDTPLRITVRTPDGQVILAESQYTIRSTAVSGVGLVLTVGAAAFLAVWWGRHWYRTRHARNQGTGPPDDAGDAAGDDEDIFVQGPM